MSFLGRRLAHPLIQTEVTKGDYLEKEALRYSRIQVIGNRKPVGLSVEGLRGGHQCAAESSKQVEVLQITRQVTVQESKGELPCM